MARASRIEITRHRRELSEQEDCEIVQIVADLIVAFLRGDHESSPDFHNVANAREVETQHA